MKQKTILWSILVVIILVGVFSLLPSNQPHSINEDPLTIPIPIETPTKNTQTTTMEIITEEKIKDIVETSTALDGWSYPPYEVEQVTINEYETKTQIFITINCEERKEETLTPTEEGVFIDSIAKTLAETYPENFAKNAQRDSSASIQTCSKTESSADGENFTEHPVVWGIHNEEASWKI